MPAWAGDSGVGTDPGESGAVATASFLAPDAVTCVP